MRGIDKTTAVCMLAGLGVALASVAVAADQGRYWRDAQGNLWRNGSGACVRTGAWTPQGYTPGCDPEPPETQVTQSEARTASGATETVQVAALEAPAESTAPRPLELNTVTLFDLDSARLRSEGARAVDEISADAKRAASIEVIEVIGHADSTGGRDYNRQLSERRALNVKRRLVSAGVDPALIRIEGRGEADPVASNATPDGRQQNRRVVVRIRGTAKH